MRSDARKTRDTEARPQGWTPPSILPDPDPRPGIVHRWIRVSTLGQPDPANVSYRMREGWEPVQASEYPEIQSQGDPNSRYTQAGNIEIGGLVLCRMSAQHAEQRDRYYENRARAQERAVSANYRSNEDPRMPLVEQRRQEVKFGSVKPSKETE